MASLLYGENIEGGEIRDRENERGRERGGRERGASLVGTGQSAAAIHIPSAAAAASLPVFSICSTGSWNSTEASKMAIQDVLDV